MISNVNNRYKTSMCRHWEQTGNCQLGPKCHFAHGQEELRTVSDPMPMNTVPRQQNYAPRTNQRMNYGEKNFQNNDSNGPGTIPSNYKTVTCKYFEKGFCKYEDKCNFAHGDSDVRPGFSGKSKQYSGMGGVGMNPMLNQGLMMSNQPQYQRMGSPMIIENSQGYNSNNTMDEAEIQSTVAQAQIKHLIELLEGYHASDPKLLGTVESAKQQLAASNNIQAAAATLNEVIQRTDRKKEDDDKYNEFISSIQELGAKLTTQYSQQQKQQQQYTGGPTGGMMSSPSGGMMGGSMGGGMMSGPSGGMMGGPMGGGMMGGGMMGGPSSGMMGGPSYYMGGSVMMQQPVMGGYDPMMMQSGGGGGMSQQKYGQNGYRSGGNYGNSQNRRYQ